MGWTKAGLGDRVMVAVIYIVLTLLMIVTFYPFWNSIVISLNSGLDASRGGLTLWPRVFTWDNYKVVVQDDRFFHAFFLTIGRVAAGVATSILLTSMFAYALSKTVLIGKKLYVVLSLVTLYFSGGLIPTYLVVKELHLINTFVVLFLPFTISVFNMIVFRTFFKELPAALEESAMMDGANHVSIFFRIYAPLSVPVFAALSLFHAVFLWNDWFYAGIYQMSQQWIPVQTYLMNLILSSSATEQMANAAGVSGVLGARSAVTTRSLQMATLILATLPIIAVYPFLQKYFVKGVLIGSLKE